MKDKQVAAYAIISTIVFIIATMSGGEYGDGMVKFFYWASVIGLYTFIIWGWVKLFKSDK